MELHIKKSFIKNGKTIKKGSVYKQRGKTKDKKEYQELIISMAKVLPLTIEDAAIIVARIDSGFDTSEILKFIVSIKDKIDKEVRRRQARYNKGCEDGMDGTRKEYGIQDPDYQAGYSFGAHARTRGN